jgi:hypothetical protein
MRPRGKGVMENREENLFRPKGWRGFFVSAVSHRTVIQKSEESPMKRTEIHWIWWTLILLFVSLPATLLSQTAESSIRQIDEPGIANMS